MCGYFCIGFVDFKGKILTEYTNISPSNNFEKNDDISLKYGMESYCLKWEKNTENIDPKISIMTLSNRASKKSRFIRNQEAKGLLNKLGIKTALSKVPILGDILL